MLQWEKRLFFALGNNVSSSNSSDRESPPAYLLTALRLVVVILLFFLLYFSFPSQPSSAGNSNYCRRTRTLAQVPKPKRQNIKKASIDIIIYIPFVTSKHIKWNAQHRNGTHKQKYACLCARFITSTIWMSQKGPSSLQPPVSCIARSINPLFFSFWVELTPSKDFFGRQKSKPFSFSFYLLFFWWPIDKLRGRRAKHASFLIIILRIDGNIIWVKEAEGHVGKEMPHNQFLVGCARSSFSWFVVGAGSSSHRAAAGDSN